MQNLKCNTNEYFSRFSEYRLIIDTNQIDVRKPIHIKRQTFRLGFNSRFTNAISHRDYPHSLCSRIDVCPYLSRVP